MRRLTAVAALVAISSAALLAVACGGDEDSEKTTTGATAGVDLGAVKRVPHRAHRRSQQLRWRTLRRNAEAYYRLADSVEFDYRRLMEDHGAAGRAAARRFQARLREGQPRLRGDGGDRRRRAALGPVRRRHRRGLGRLRPRERRLVQPRAAQRRDAEAAREPVLRHRDGALRHQPRLPRQGREAGRRPRRQGGVRRGASRRGHLRRRRARVRPSGDARSTPTRRTSTRPRPTPSRRW